MKCYLDANNDRLVYIGGKADREMWDERWEKENIEKLFFPKKSCGKEKSIIDITRRYLSEGSRILEGGCGLGINVQMMERIGYEVTGVDYAEKTIEKMNFLMPSLDLRCGNLESLQFDNNYFDGYWSFGVIEHYYGGYDKIAYEMFRVIKPGGYLFLTVPAFSKLRRIKAALGFYPNFFEDKVDIGEFYQFALSPEQVKEDLTGKGFKFVEQDGWSVYKGMSDEIPGSRLVMSLLCRVSEEITENVLRNFCNHMYIFVFRK